MPERCSRGSYALRVGLFLGLCLYSEAFAPPVSSAVRRGMAARGQDSVDGEGFFSLNVSMLSLNAPQERKGSDVSIGDVDQSKALTSAFIADAKAKFWTLQALVAGRLGPLLHEIEAPINAPKYERLGQFGRRRLRVRVGYVLLAALAAAAEGDLAFAGVLLLSQPATQVLGVPEWTILPVVVAGVYILPPPGVL